MAKLKEAEFEALYAAETNVTTQVANEDINAFKRVMKMIAKSGDGVGFCGVGVFSIKPTTGRPWSINGKSGVSEDGVTLKFKVSNVLKDAMNADLSEN